MRAVIPEKVLHFARLIKLEHTLFALPFSLASMLIAQRGLPAASTVGLVMTSIVCGRSFAMALNRVIDRHIDARNPRTKDRELPAGRLGLGEVLLFLALALAGLIWSVSLLPPLCMKLLPLALFLLVSYSYTKRFTIFCHFVLGVTLATPVVGSRIAVTGVWDNVSVLLAAAVVCWVSGFDILYACQDIEVDREQGLCSIPSRLGVAGSLCVTGALHTLVPVFLTLFGMTQGLAAVYYLGIAIIAMVLAWELSLLRDGNLARIEVAFFHANVVVSFVYLVSCAAAVL